MRHQQSISITGARVIPGRSRGRKIGVPTINVDPADAPENLTHGIYACFVAIEGEKYPAAMHFGSRPVFRDSETLEIHVLDATIDHAPKTLDIAIVGRIRDVRDFPSVKALQKAIASDIRDARAILKTYEKAHEKTRS